MRHSWLGAWRRIGLVLVAAVALALGASTQADARRWGKGYFPDVNVVTQHGKSIPFYDGLIKDKIFVINFLYTSCREYCPLIASRLAELQDVLGDDLGSKYFIYSITVDPEIDTPERLKEYADAFGAKPGWLFLTGKPEDIRAIRYKLGDRGDLLSDHRTEILLGNGATSQWARNSAMGDISSLAIALRSMDPKWRVKFPKRSKPRAMHVDLDERTGEALFVRLCKGCHTVGKGDKVGPDLAGVAARRNRDWLVSFMTGPEKMRRRKDPTVMELVARFPAVRMPPLGLGDNDAKDLLTYIAYLEGKGAQRDKPLATLFGLTTHKGKRFTREAVEGKPVAVFFGFTHCPDVCPTTLMDWSNALADLGKDGDRLKVVFVTIDSERDTQEALASYMGSFDPRIVALTGESTAINHAARSFDAFHERIGGKDGNYTFDHTTNVYIVGRDGRLAGKVNLKTSAEDRRKLLDKVLAQTVAAGQ